MAWLQDTNVLSELRKPRAEQKVLDFVTSTPLAELYVPMFDSQRTLPVTHGARPGILVNLPILTSTLLLKVSY